MNADQCVRGGNFQHTGRYSAIGAEQRFELPKQKKKIMVTGRSSRLLFLPEMAGKPTRQTLYKIHLQNGHFLLVFTLWRKKNSGFSGIFLKK
jgi:hypothetical protein